MKRAYGFTIVELLIVIVVIAILAAISVAAYGSIRDRAELSGMQAETNSIEKALNMYKVEHGAWPLCTAVDGSSCQFTVIEPTLRQYVSGLPVNTGDGSSRIYYVAHNGQDRWSIRLMLSDGSYCKAGYRMITTWWSSAPDCW